MGTLLKSLREYKVPSILCPIVMVGEAAMEIIIPYLMTFIIGELRLLSADPAYQVNTQNIIIYSVLMVVCAGFALFCGVWGGRLSAKASCGFAHNLREDMYNNIQTYSFANIDNYSTASLITRVTTDVTNVQNAYQMTIRMLVRAPVLFVSSIVMTCVIEPTMALIFVGGAVILGLIVFFCMFKVIPYFKKMFEKYDGLNSVVQENLTAIRVVKSYVREGTEIDKMQRATAEVYKYSVKAEKIFTILMPCVSLVMYATIIVIFTVGSNMAVGNIAGYELLFGHFFSGNNAGINAKSNLFFVVGYFYRVTVAGFITFGEVVKLSGISSVIKVKRIISVIVGRAFCNFVSADVNAYGYVCKSQSAHRCYADIAGIFRCARRYRYDKCGNEYNR